MFIEPMERADREDVIRSLAKSFCVAKKDHRSPIAITGVTVDGEDLILCLCRKGIFSNKIQIDPRSSEETVELLGFTGRPRKE
jgi:hypothetical protein